MARKQDTRAIEEWQKGNVDRIIIKPNKKLQVADRIQLAIDRGVAKNRQSYIVNAILKQLEADGIPMTDKE